MNAFSTISDRSEEISEIEIKTKKEFEDLHSSTNISEINEPDSDTSSRSSNSRSNIETNISYPSFNSLGKIGKKSFSKSKSIDHSVDKESEVYEVSEGIKNFYLFIS